MTIKWLVAFATASAGPALAETPHPFNMTAPPGQCAFEPAAAGNAGLSTGFKPGLPLTNVLVAMFVPCDQLERAKAGRTAWLPEWMAIEKNAVTIPSDDERLVESKSAGQPRSPVDLLCRDAQDRHWKIDAETFEGKTASALKSLTDANPQVFFGVIGQDRGTCYMASLTLEPEPNGAKHKMLNVFAIMAAGDTWVYHTTRRFSDDASNAQETLYIAKNAARALLRENE
jgi:hypothetical protein